MPQGLGEERIRRLLAILAMLPVKGVGMGISTSEIRELLRLTGLEVNIRSVQRDVELLERMSSLGELGIEIIAIEDKKARVDKEEKEPSGTVVRYCLKKPFVNMTFEQASAFLLVEQILEPLIPTPVIEQLVPYFREARNHFFKTARVIRKEEKVGFIPWGFSLLHPDFKEKREVVNVIFRALFQEKRFLGSYKSRGQEKAWEAVFNPLAYVGREGGGYLVVTWGDSDEYRHLPLHRFEQAELLDEDIPEKIVGRFELSKYLEEFTYPIGKGPIKLKLKLREFDAQALKERRVSDDQKIQDILDGAILTATVNDSESLRRWILGYGANAEVLEPQDLRMAITDRLKEASTLYSPDNPKNSGRRKYWPYSGSL